MQCETHSSNCRADRGMGKMHCRCSVDQYFMAIIKFGGEKLPLDIHDFEFFQRINCQTPVINSLLQQTIVQMNRDNLRFTGVTDLSAKMKERLTPLIEHHYQTVVSVHSFV